MSLIDETFPDDSLIIDSPVKRLQSILNLQSKNEQNCLSPLREQGSNTSYSTSATNSSMVSSCQEKSSDESKTAINCNKIVTDKSKYSNKSQSYQDLHSVITKKRYQHVKSKVREYIENLKAEGHRKRTKTIFRHRSLPETLTGSKEFHEKMCETDSDGILKKLLEKEEEISELKTQNEYLHNNLQEKLALVARLRRNADSTRIELLQMKEKEKTNRYSKGSRYSLPLLEYRNFEKISVATQTEEFEISNYVDYNNVHLIQSNFLSSDETNSQRSEEGNLRKRTNSNSSKSPKTPIPKSSSILSKVNYDENSLTSESEIENNTYRGLSNSRIDPVDLNAFIQDKKRWKCKLIKKNYLRALLCSCCDKQDACHEDYIYTSLPLNENEFGLRTEVNA